MLVAALTVALVARPTQTSLLLLLAAIVLSFLALAFNGLYEQDDVGPGHSTPDEIMRIAISVTLGAWAACVVGMVARSAELGIIAAFWIAALVDVIALRAVTRAICQRRAWFRQGVVVVGAGRVGHLVADKYGNHPEFGVDVLGFVDDDPLTEIPLGSTPPLLGGLDDLPDLIHRLQVDRVLVAFSRESPDEMLTVLRAVRTCDVHLDIVPRYFDLVGPSATMHQLEGVGIVGLPPARPSRHALAAKRALDVAVSGVLLLVLAPLLVLLSLLVRLDSRGPTLYRGQRIGRGGREIELRKFRTMHPDAEARLAELLTDDDTRREFEATHKLARDPRVTRLGGWLRQTSLDELPQLVNVFRGELSLVGPRPVTKHEWDLRFGTDCAPAATNLPGYWHVDELRPGLTGYWQVSGRSVTTFEERMRLDMGYLSSWSLRFDLYILARTIRAVLARDGAY